ncbi:MAG: hypothetical protein F6J93_19350 [Oscillatoria sp. SIO1A7]|nr:hypothetical protein [Oscillatoria sp. SIO1A7]
MMSNNSRSITYSSQRSAVSAQQSAVSGQQSAVSGQRSAVSPQIFSFAKGGKEAFKGMFFRFGIKRLVSRTRPGA